MHPLGVTSTYGQQQQADQQVGMVVCGDDGLARRLAAELRDVYREHVTLVVPTTGEAGSGPAHRRAGGGRFGLLGRIPAARASVADGQAAAVRERVLETGEPTEEVLASAGVTRAAALALVYEDDATNLRAALIARRLNPRLRLVIRLYNRKLGQHLEELLDQAAIVAEPGIDLRELDSSTTVLSDADTAAPALAATAVAGTNKIVQADGLLLRAVERTPPQRGQTADPGLCTLALLSATTNDPAGNEGPSSAGTKARNCCRTTARWAPRQGGASWPWKRCPTRDPHRPHPGWAPLRSRSTRSSQGGCAGRWPASWRLLLPSPWPRGRRRGTTLCTLRTSPSWTSSRSTTQRWMSHHSARFCRSSPASSACSCCPSWWRPH